MKYTVSQPGYKYEVTIQINNIHETIKTDGPLVQKWLLDAAELFKFSVVDMSACLHRSDQLHASICPNMRNDERKSFS